MKPTTILGLWAMLALGAALAGETRLLTPGGERSRDWAQYLALSPAGDRDRIHLDPVWPSADPWWAVRDAEFEGERFNAFFYQGIVFSGHSRVRHSTFRVSTYPRDLTAWVHCSDFALAMMREREVVAFVVAEGPGPVAFRLDAAVLGEAVELSLPMRAGEVRLLRFFVDQPPFRP